MSSKKKNKSTPAADLENEIKDYLSDENIMDRMNQLQSKYDGQITERMRDFAMHRALDPSRTLVYWSRFFGVHDYTVKRWSQHPTVKNLTAEIKGDIRKFHFIKLLYLGKEALRTYEEVLTTPMTKSNMSNKIRVANHVTELIQAAAGIVPNSGTSINFNLGDGGSDNPMIVVRGVAAPNYDDDEPDFKRYKEIEAGSEHEKNNK